MDKKEIIQKRLAIVDEARSWLGTPFHHEARVKGAGIDCGMLLLEVFEGAGLAPHIVPDHYPSDFMLHRDEEWYLSIVRQYAVEIPETPPPLPGDVFVCQIGRLFAHGGVVMDWPRVIHASVQDRRVLWGDLSKGYWASRKRMVFRHQELICG